MVFLVQILALIAGLALTMAGGVPSSGNHGVGNGATVTPSDVFLPGLG